MHRQRGPSTNHTQQVLCAAITSYNWIDGRHCCSGLDPLLSGSCVLLEYVPSYASFWVFFLLLAVDCSLIGRVEGRCLELPEAVMAKKKKKREGHERKDIGMCRQEIAIQVSVHCTNRCFPRFVMLMKNYLLACLGQVVEKCRTCWAILLWSSRAVDGFCLLAPSQQKVRLPPKLGLGDMNG